MTRIRTTCMALLAVLALSAVAAASASATPAGPIWKVAGAKLESGKEKAFSSEQTASYELKGKAFGFINITITCTKAKATGDLIGGTPGKGEATVEYTGCSAGGLCTVSEPIKVTKAKLTLGWVLKESKYFAEIVWAPHASTEPFVTITCGSIKAEVKGNTASEVLSEAGKWVENGNETEGTKGFTLFTGAEETKVFVNGTEETEKLTLEGNASTLKGESNTKLTSGEKFGAFE